MTIETFKRAELLQRQIQQFSELIGLGTGSFRIPDKYIAEAVADEQVKKAVEDKILRLQKEFDEL